MKKILFLLIIACITANVAISCSNESEDIFDQSAAQRINSTVTKYSSLLQSSDNGWVMEYLPGYPNYFGGYIYTANFKGDDVEMRSQITLINPGTGNIWQAGSAVTSKYDIKPEQGVILSFDSYNVLFHYWSRPTGYNYAGYQGDYEFEFLRTSNDNDTIYLRGKKYGNDMMMSRLNGSAQDYIGKVINMVNVTENPDRRYFTVNGTQYPFVITEGGIMRIITQDSTDIVAQGRMIFRQDGFYICDPMEIDGTEMKYFTYDTINGDFTSETGAAVIKMPSVADQFLNPRYNWVFSANTKNQTYNSEYVDSLYSLFSSLYSEDGNMKVVGTRQWAFLSNKAYGEFKPNSHYKIYATYTPTTSTSLIGATVDLTLSDDNSQLEVDMLSNLPNTYNIGVYKFAQALSDASPYKVEFNDGAYKHSVLLKSISNPDVWFTLELNPYMSVETSAYDPLYF